MKTTLREDVVQRARAKYAQGLEAVAAYLGPNKPDPRDTKIASDPLASELLSRGYGLGVAEEATRRTE